MINIRKNFFVIPVDDDFIKTMTMIMIRNMSKKLRQRLLSSEFKPMVTIEFF